MFGQRKAAPAYGADGETPEQFRDVPTGTGSANGRKTLAVRDSTKYGSRLAAIFVRHGDTAANKGEGREELVRGQRDYPLNSDGRAEATQAGRTIARHGGVSKVYSSPLSRGRDTATAIGKATGSDTSVTRTLLPWDKGNAEGKPIAEEDPKLRDYALHKRNTPVPGGEAYGKFATRTDSAARSLVRAGRRSVQSTGKPVAAVSHSVDMRRLGHAIEGKPEPDPLKGGPKPGEMVGVTVGNRVVKVKPGMWGTR